jgi:hypothetical protein
MAKETLLQSLRKTRSSNKTKIIYRWPEIREALEAGFEKKHIFDELVKKDKLTISYAQFTRITKELSVKEVNHPASVSVSSGKAALKKTPSKKKENPSQREPADLADGSVTEGPIIPKSPEIRRFKHNPIPDEEELYGE